jgi:diphosphomevalonate decarboxylase
MLARLGSGSASRSVFGGWVTWGKTEKIIGSSNEYASPLDLELDPLFRDMGVAVMIVSGQPKKLSSSLGHQLMEQHPWAPARYVQAENHLEQILHAMKSGDFEEFSQITENEALSLHSLLMTSAPEGLLIKPASLKIIEEVRHFRARSGIPVCFTMDAGPNVLLIYPRQFKDQITDFIRADLVRHCENGRWIDDQLGKGPMKIKEA